MTWLRCTILHRNTGQFWHEQLCFLFGLKFYHECNCIFNLTYWGCPEQRHQIIYHNSSQRTGLARNLKAINKGLRIQSPLKIDEEQIDISLSNHYFLTSNDAIPNLFV